MPTPTYTPLANLTLSVAAGTIAITDISQGYRDLIIVVTSKLSSGSSQTNVNIAFNGDTASNYERTTLFGDGTTTGGSNNADRTWAVLNNNTNWVMDVFDYSVTDKAKTALTRTSNSNQRRYTIGRWNSTAAITSVSFTSSTTFAIGSTVAIYGVSA